MDPPFRKGGITNALDGIEDNSIWKNTDISSFELKSDSEELEYEYEDVFHEFTRVIEDKQSFKISLNQCFR